MDRWGVKNSTATKKHLQGWSGDHAETGPRRRPGARVFSHSGRGMRASDRENVHQTGNKTEQSACGEGQNLRKYRENPSGKDYLQMVCFPSTTILCFFTLFSSAVCDMPRALAALRRLSDFASAWWMIRFS